MDKRIDRWTFETHFIRRVDLKSKKIDEARKKGKKQKVKNTNR